MIRKRVCRSLAITSIVSFVLMGMGCESTQNSPKKELLVVTDFLFQKQVIEAADFMMDINDEYTIQVETLSEDYDLREKETKKLQTQIMAGKGPDVYILNATMENQKYEGTPFFKNPYKIMESGALAPLDTYMKKDSYWKDSTYKKELLEAGKYNKRQYIIPFSCDYFVFCSPTDGEQMKGETIKEWLQQVEDSGSQELKNAMSLRLTAGRWFSPAIDYETKKILFSKEQWSDFALSYLNLRSNESVYIENNPYTITNLFLNEDLKGKTLQFIPNMQGKKVAAVKAYGAVGMSSSFKDEAYQFLMLFLNDTIESEMQKVDKATRIQGYIDQEGIPVQEAAIRAKAKMQSVDESTAEQVCKTFSEIEDAFFVTDVERKLSMEIEALEFDPIKADMEKRVDNVSENIWKNYQTLMTE